MRDLRRLKAGIQYACELEKDIRHDERIFNINEYDFFDDHIVIFCSDKIREFFIDKIEKLDFKVVETNVEISIKYDGNLYTYCIV